MFAGQLWEEGYSQCQHSLIRVVRTGLLEIVFFNFFHLWVLNIAIEVDYLFSYALGPDRILQRMHIQERHSFSEV